MTTQSLPNSILSNPDSLPDLLKRREVCAITRISVGSIDNAVKNGFLPAPIRIGARTLRWKKSDILAVLAN